MTLVGLEQAEGAVDQERLQELETQRAAAAEELAASVDALHFDGRLKH